MGETITCGFCGKKTIPKRVEEERTVTYWCVECNSLIAAYQKEFENTLKFGSLFRKYPITYYKTTSQVCNKESKGS